MDEEVLEMVVEELKEYLKVHPDILIHVTLEESTDEGSEN